MKLDNYCQSCAMPLTQGKISNYGTEVNGSKSDIYCKMCYQNGQFIEPNITYDQMLGKGIIGIEQSTTNKVKRLSIIASKDVKMALKQR